MIPMSTLASLRAEVARTIAALPEVFRSCSADVLCDVIAPEFTEDDHNRCAHSRIPPQLPFPLDPSLKRRTKTNHPPMAPVPIPAVSERTQIDPRRKHLTTDQSHRSHPRSPTKLNPNVTPPPAKWTALVEAMKDPRLSSSDAVKELETAAAALEARIRDADETHATTNGDDEYGYIHSRPLGTGLVSCGSCGRTLAAEALVSHRKENCAGARRALGAEGVARALGGVWGAVDVPQAPAAAVIPAASPPKPAKKMTKKALKEQAAAAAAGMGMGTGTGTGVAPGAQPMQAMQGVGGALTHRGSPAYDLQHQLFLQQQQHQQQGGQLRRVNSAGLASLGPTDFELASGPLGMGASASMPGVVPPLTAAEKKAAGAKRKREAKAAAAKAAKVAGLSGAPTAQQPPQQQPPQPQQPQQPGAPVTPGMYDAATLAQLNAQTARHIQQRRAAMAHRLAQQQRQRAQMEVERERNHGWKGISPLARVADVGRLRHLRQRALYSIMFHGTQQELLDRMSPNIVPAQMYLSGASEVLPPFPAVTG